MANEAHKEPTMEEILASIRKIISDDSSSSSSAAAPASAPEIANDDVDSEDSAVLEDVMFDEDVSEDIDETVEEFEVEDFEDEVIEKDFADEEYETADPTESFETLLSASRAAASQPPAKPVPASVDPVPPAASMEKAMSVSPAYEQTTLTDDSTASAAAGALGKLISKMDLGRDNTIEGLVREMLRPMIKEWLDANLAKIVEEKVEAEVQRIARMAR